MKSVPLLPNRGREGKSIAGGLKPMALRKTAAIALPTLLAVWLLGYCTLRALSHGENQYNEGWNAYHGLRAARGLPLYAEKFGLTPNNYPPLSFHLTGMLARAGADLVSAGRALSLAGFFA